MRGVPKLVGTRLGLQADYDLEEAHRALGNKGPESNGFLHDAASGLITPTPFSKTRL